MAEDKTVHKMDNMAYKVAFFAGAFRLRMVDDAGSELQEAKLGFPKEMFSIGSEDGVQCLFDGGARLQPCIDFFKLGEGAA